MNSRLILSSLLSLLLGACIYVFFRDPSIIFFGWLADLGLLNGILEIQEHMVSIKKALPNAVIYSLPDGLWLFSYVCLMLHIWRNALRPTGLIWTFALPVLAITFEVLQTVNPSFGTFDWLDLIMYLLASTLPLVAFKKSINFNSNSNLHA